MIRKSFRKIQHRGGPVDRPVGERRKFFSLLTMAGFDTGSGRFVTWLTEGVDGRVKPGHDVVGESRGCRHALPPKRLYHAIIFEGDGKSPGRRVSVFSESLSHAKRELETKYGEGTVFDLHNKEDVEKPRSL
jgi:hypothetical protein